MHSRPFLALIVTAFLISCSEIYSGPSPIKNFRVIIPGEVYSGARPNAEGLRWLESLGVNTVRNLDRGMWLETSVEVERDWKAARQLDIRFVHLPFHPTRPPTIREFTGPLRSYRTLRPAPSSSTRLGGATARAS